MLQSRELKGSSDDQKLTQSPESSSRPYDAMRDDNPNKLKLSQSPESSSDSKSFPSLPVEKNAFLGSGSQSQESKSGIGTMETNQKSLLEAVRKRSVEKHKQRVTELKSIKKLSEEVRNLLVEKHNLWLAETARMGGLSETERVAKGKEQLEEQSHGLHNEL